MNLSDYIDIANQVINNYMTLDDAEEILDKEFYVWYYDYFLPYYESKESTRLWAIELVKIQGIINGVYQNLLNEATDLINTLKQFSNDDLSWVMSDYDKFNSMSYEELSILSEKATAINNFIIEKSERFNAIKDTIAKQQLDIYGSAKIAYAGTIFKSGDIMIKSVQNFCLSLINLIHMQQELMTKYPNE